MQAARGEASLKWVWRGSAIGVVVLGWLFIYIKNNFHLTPSVFYVMLAWLAGIGAIYALFRTGASAVGPEAEPDPESWGLPASARDELEREKRTLLKAIKEAEFDHQMGKLTKADLDQMVRNYRLRAIEVIKLLDTGGSSTRDEILREVRARAEVEAVRDKVERAHAGLTRRKNPNKAAAAAQAAARAAAAAGASPTVAAEAAKAAALATDLEAEDSPPADAKADDTSKTDAAKPEPKASAKPSASDAAKSDEAASKTDAASDNTTSDESAAKAEATPPAATSEEPAAKADHSNGSKADAKSDVTDTRDTAKADDKADAKEATP